MRCVGKPTLERPIIAGMKVLVVEDDPLILMTAAEALREAGFTVVEAETADEAAAILRTAADQVRVVFSDIEMPGSMNGLTLARIVSDAWPAISVVLTSGRLTPCPSTLPDRARFVAKPYDLGHVATLIVELAEA